MHHVEFKSSDEMSTMNGSGHPRDRSFLDSRPTNFLYWAAVAVTMLGFLAACLQGVANGWVWGHDGFNGAAFAQAVRNSLRFHTWGMAQYHMGLAQPETWEFYTHHPMLLNLHIMGLFKAFGYSEWGARLPSACYSWLSLMMLFLFVKRYYGRAYALLSIVAYALIPLNLIYANMVSHEQGSLFWCLFFVYFYSRWREEGRAWFMVLILFGVSMAVQYDWGAYYIAFFTVVHAFVAGVRRGGTIWTWRREYTFCVLFSIVVLVNVFVFYLYIVEIRGGIEEMASAYAHRTASRPDYIAKLWGQSVDLFGLFYLALIPIWAFHYGIRFRRGTTHLGDQIPVYFLLAQAIHSTVFKDAGYMHAYWTYYLNPGLAVMVATVLISCVKWASGMLIRRCDADEDGYAGGTLTQRGGNGFAVTAVVVSLVIVVPMTLQARFACKQWVWGFDTGGASYTEPYSDHYMDLVFAEHLAKRFNRSNADFLIHWGLAWRLEPLAYLDAPHEWVGRLQFLPSELQNERHQLLLLNLEQVNDIDLVGKLVREHPAWIYDEKFVAIDGSVGGGNLTAYYSRAEEPSLWWNWLVNFRRPPVVWVEKPVEARLEGIFTDSFEATTTESAGGPGGETIKWHCPYGYLLTGFDAWITEGHPVVVRGLLPECRRIGAVLENLAREERGRFQLGGLGDRSGNPGRALLCSDGSFVSGIRGQAGQFVDSFGVECSVFESAQNPQASATFSTRSEDSMVVAGGSGGDSFHIECPAGTAGFGLETASGAYLDRIALTCVVVDADFVSGDPQPSSSIR